MDNANVDVLQHSQHPRQVTIPLVPVLIGGIILIVGGIITGYMLSRPSGTEQTSQTTAGDGKEQRQVFGAPADKVFPDSAEGTLEVGGLDGQGTHKLIRPGGESQTIYLTSSLLDLNQFENKKVHIWGETFASKSAGWFMDVGRVEVLE